MNDISAISDAQAEAGIIATLIKHPEFIINVGYMKPNYFYDLANASLYWCIQTLVENGIDNIDALNLSNAMNSNKAIKKKMEEYNITNIQEFLSYSQYAARDTLEEYKLLINNVITLAFKRELNKAAVDIQKSCFNDTFDLESLNTLVNDKLTGLSGKFIVGTDSILLGEKLDELWNEICEDRNPDGTVGFPSKIKEFNKYFSFLPGELVLLTARMKRGKSMYFMNEAVHLAINNHVPTLVIDTEMSDKLFLKRLISCVSGVEYKKIETGKYSEEESRMIEDAKIKIKEAPLVHEYIPEKFNASKIQALCQQWKYKMNLQFVIYDYMKYNSGAGASEISNMLGDMCDFLKNVIAGDMNLAVLAGAQLNRQDEVSSSDKIEMYCSTSIRWRAKTSEELSQDSLECGNFCASIVLNRNGAQTDEDDYIDIKLDGDRMSITQAKQHSQPEKLPFD